MGWVERCVAIVAGVAVVAAVSVLVANSDVSRIEGSATVTLSDTPTPVPPTPKPLPAAAVPQAVRTATAPGGIGAVTTTGLAQLRTSPKLNGKSKGPVPRGVLSAVIGRKGEFFRVFTPNENTGWIHMSKLDTHKKARTTKVTRLRDATIVIDPGHGGHQPGAMGKRGLSETVANVGIAKRIVPLLKDARVFMTNTGQHAGLAYRASLANKLGAHVFMSVHNNALPDKFGKRPGAEIYYSQRPGSKRLAGLLYEELFKTLRKYRNVTWGRDPFAGAKFRLSQQHGGDYYAVLRRSLTPAVIVESMFITNPSEERLLRQARVRQDIAEALARGVRRFLTTGDPGSGYQNPYAKPTPKCPIPGCFEHRK